MKKDVGCSVSRSYEEGNRIVRNGDHRRFMEGFGGRFEV